MPIPDLILYHLSMLSMSCCSVAKAGFLFFSLCCGCVVFSIAALHRDCALSRVGGWNRVVHSEGGESVWYALGTSGCITRGEMDLSAGDEALC